MPSVREGPNYPNLFLHLGRHENALILLVEQCVGHRCLLSDAVKYELQAQPIFDDQANESPVGSVTSAAIEN